MTVEHLKSLHDAGVTKRESGKFNNDVDIGE